MRNHKEDDLQEHCVRWFKYSYPDIIILSIPNGGSRNAIEAAKLKHTCTLAGVADLFIMKNKWEDVDLEPVGYTETYLKSNGLFIELKVGKNQQTTAQLEFMENAQKAGYSYQICRSIDEFMQIVNEYLNLKLW